MKLSVLIMEKGSETDRYPNFCLTKNADAAYLENIKDYYTENENNAVMLSAAKIQAETYGSINRVEETILFAKEMGYHYIHGETV